MDQLRKQVARARRRLITEQFLGRLVACVLAAMIVAAIAVAVPRVIAIENLPERWDLGWLAGGLAGALLAAIAWTVFSNRSPLDAAIEIDRRFDLRERIASSLSLSPDEQSSEAGRAVVSDALRAVNRINVDDKFRLQLGRRALWPLVPAAIVFVLVAFVDNRHAESSLDSASAAKTAQQTKTALESLRKKMEEQRAKLDKDKNLQKADGLFKQIEQGTRELAEKQKMDPTKAAVKLNDLAKQLEERRQQLGGKDGLKEQFQKMKNLGAGPAEKAAEALKQGDFKKALDEVEKLAKELREGKMDAATKEQLAKQLEQMKQKLEAAAQNHLQAMEDLKKQIEQQKKQGNLAKAGDLQQKLDQLQKQQAQMNKLQQLAQQMGQCQQCLKQGDGQKAADAMAQMAKQLDQMQQDMNEMEMLNAAMDQLEMTKDAMGCKFCNGEGCEHCMGNMANNGGKNMNGKPGRGMGQGVGIGERPEERNATNLRDSQVRTNPRRGAATFGGLVEGPNIKGEVGQSIKEEMATLMPSRPTRLRANGCRTAGANTQSNISRCSATGNRWPRNSPDCLACCGVGSSTGEMHLPAAGQDRGSWRRLVKLCGRPGSLLCVAERPMCRRRCRRLCFNNRGHLRASSRPRLGGELRVCREGKDFSMYLYVDPRQVFYRFRCLVRCRIAFAAWALAALAFGAAAVAEDLPDVGGLVEKARSNFKPASEQQVSAARADLQKQMNEIERFVQPSSQNGQRWLRYLKWDALKQQVNEEQPMNVEAVDATLEKLNRNVSGLEHRRFRGLAKALRHYHDTLALALLDKPAEVYNQQLGALQQALDAYRKEPTPKTEMELSERIRILDSIGQSPELVQAVRSEMDHPNAFVSITTSLIAAGIDPVNRSEAITDCILGTNIHGDAHTTGSAGVVTIPSDNKAVLEFSSQGHTWSDNVGYHSPAVIRSTSDTDFTATKRVEMSDAAFVGQPARASATTDTHFHSVSKQGGGLGSRLVSRIGWNRARQSEHQAEAIASDHAEDRIQDHFNDEVNDEVSKLRQRYEDEYRRPLERRGEVPEHIRFSTGKSSLNVEVTQANRSQLGAQGAPPAAGESHDMTMRLHESAVNNYSASLLGGATATQTTPDEDLKFNVELPKWMKRMWNNRKTEATDDAAAKDEAFKEYAMTLRDGRPLSVKFTDDKVQLTLHISELNTGDKSFADWDVTGTYAPELKDGHVALHREGKLVMLPSDFSGKLDTQQTAERANLEKEFDKRSAQGKGFPQTIEFDPVKPEGKLAQSGPLDYHQFSSKDGWLVIGLDRHSKHAELPTP